MLTDFVIKNTSNKGKGLFSLKQFPKNHVLFSFDGKNIDKVDIPNFSTSDPVENKKLERLLQVGQELFLDIENHSGVFVNHSCNPNCAVKITTNKAFLISILPIKIGDELAYDYSLTSTETIDTFYMPCSCSKFGCRKVITGFHSIPKDKQTKYIDLDAVPKYVLNTYGLKK